jgi:AAA15 family ATPase/GTPase
MYISRLKLAKWRNFKEVDVNLKHRIFILGANASGKSNLFDVIRFLRDIVKQGGGGIKWITDIHGNKGSIWRLYTITQRSTGDLRRRPIYKIISMYLAQQCTR